MKKNKWNHKKCIFIIIMLCIQFIAVMYSYDLWKNIDAKKETTYQVKEDYIDSVQENGVEYQYNLNLYVRNPKRILVDVNIDGEETNVQGTVECEIIDENASTIYKKIYTLDEIKEDGGIKVDGHYFSELSSKSYQCILKCNSSNYIHVQKSYWNNLSVVEYFDYKYSQISKIMLLIANIFLLGFNLLLASKVKSEIKFGAVATVIGIASVFIIAPCSAPDEWRHFLRAYDIASGNMICTESIEVLGGTQTTGKCIIPVEYVEIRKSGEVNGSDWTAEGVTHVSIPHLKQMLQQKELSGEMEEAPMLGTYAKGPIEYIPQIIGILVGKLLKSPPIMVFYLARLMNVFICTLIVIIALKITPCYKKILSCLYFVPVMSFLRGAVSTDGLLYSLVIFIIAYTLKLNYYKKRITIKNLFVFGLCTAYIGIIKLPYILIPVVLLLVLGCNYKKERISTLIEIGIILVITIIVRMVVVNFFASGITGGETETESILIYSITHFLQVLSLLVRTFFDTLLEHTTNAIAWPVGQFTFIAYAGIIFWTIVYDEKIKWSYMQQWLLLGGAVVAWAGIIFTFYTISDIGSTTIWGIQGRYMTPLIPLAAIGIKSVINERKELLNRYMYTLVLGCNALYFLKIFQIYWCS